MLVGGTVCTHTLQDMFCTDTDGTYTDETRNWSAHLLRGQKNMPTERTHGKQCARMHVADGADRWPMARKRTYTHTHTQLVRSL